MSEPRPLPTAPDGRQTAHASAGPETFDTEISVRQVVMTMVWVTGITLVSVFLMWLMVMLFKKMETSSAEPITPIQAANRQAPPPEPHLEESPYANLDAMRAEEDQLLDHPGWVDREQGVVRLSIDQAIGVLAERGLPHSAPPSAAPVPPMPQSATTQPGTGTAIPPDALPSHPVSPLPPHTEPPPGGHS